MKSFLRRFSVLTSLLALLALIWGLWFVGPVSAVTKQFTWVAPTARMNGTALDPTEIASYILMCGNASGGPYDAWSQRTGDNSESYQTGDVFGAGTWYCVALTEDTMARISLASNEATFVVDTCDVTDCRPNPPTLFALAP